MSNSVFKILLVDDEPDIVEFLGYNLKKEGYEILTANNGKDAVEIAKKEFDKTQHEISTIFSQQNQLQQQSLQQLKYYQAEGLPMAESIINAAQHSYKAGDIGYIEYIQNIKDAFKIKTDYLATINSYNQTIIKLNYLLNR